MFLNTAGFGQLAEYISLMQRRPDAVAVIKGSSEYPGISGRVRFYQAKRGVLVFVEVSGLPTSRDICTGPFFAFHVHEGGACSGNSSDPFAAAGSHYNPNGCLHPEHAGDMPPLLGNNGYALQIFLTNRFSVREIIGRTVIIHSNPDDFTTQPGGSAGGKIACGMIRRQV